MGKLGNYQEYNIGYNPDTVQSRWGNPQTSPFGNAIRGGFAPLNGANYDWFVYDPYYWPTDYMGVQVAGVMPSEYLFGDYRGYQGIMPWALQNISQEPYPYQQDYPYNASA